MRTCPCARRPASHPRRGRRRRRPPPPVRARVPAAAGAAPAARAAPRRSPWAPRCVSYAMSAGDVIEAVRSPPHERRIARAILHGRATSLSDIFNTWGPGPAIRRGERRRSRQKVPVNQRFGRARERPPGLPPRQECDDPPCAAVVSSTHVIFAEADETMLWSIRAGVVHVNGGSSSFRRMSAQVAANRRSAAMDTARTPGRNRRTCDRPIARTSGLAIIDASSRCE